MNPLLQKKAEAWHHVDVRGLLPTEQERNFQLVDVFGPHVQVVRAPSRAELDATWTLKYRDHTVDPFVAQEKGVQLLHLRPAKRASITERHLEQGLSRGLFLRSELLEQYYHDQSAVLKDVIDALSNAIQVLSLLYHGGGGAVVINHPDSAPYLAMRVQTCLRLINDVYGQRQRGQYSIPDYWERGKQARRKLHTATYVDIPKGVAQFLHNMGFNETGETGGAGIWTRDCYSLEVKQTGEWKISEENGIQLAGGPDFGSLQVVMQKTFGTKTGSVQLPGALRQKLRAIGLILTKNPDWTMEPRFIFQDGTVACYQDNPDNSWPDREHWEIFKDMEKIVASCGGEKVLDTVGAIRCFNRGLFYVDTKTMPTPQQFRAIGGLAKNGEICYGITEPNGKELGAVGTLGRFMRECEKVYEGEEDNG